MDLIVTLTATLKDEIYGFSDLLECYRGELTDSSKKDIKELIEEDIIYLLEQCEWDIQKKENSALPPNNQQKLITRQK
jgi:hypothetical protein